MDNTPFNRDPTTPSDSERRMKLRSRAATGVLSLVMCTPAVAEATHDVFASEPDLSAIECTGAKDVTAQPGDTFDGLIAENTELPEEMGPAAWKHLVDGITIREGEVAKGETITIQPGKITVASRHITAGNKYSVPAECDVVE